MEDMIKLDDLISTIVDKETLGEGIAKLAAKSIIELKEDFKEIDAKYDSRYNELEEERRSIYKDQLESLNSECDMYEKLIFESQTKEDKEKYLKLYIETTLKKDAFFEMANKKVEEKHIVTTKEAVISKDQSKQFVAGVAIAVASIAVWEGVKWLAKNYFKINH